MRRKQTGLGNPRKQMISIPDLVATVERFDPAGADRARASRRQKLALLRRDEKVLDRRSYSPGHV
ncbi:MAG: hypothetical protein HY560_12740, partial [Gemmatimonadetes bacterium]|nr:hypothetical protein [Gemmatimonadota bacterium]